MGRAYSRSDRIECGSLGRWPRMVWIRAVGPRGAGADRRHVRVGVIPGGWPFGNKWPERCDVPIHGPSGCIGGACAFIRVNSCHSWFHPRTAPHLTALARK